MAECLPYRPGGMAVACGPRHCNSCHAHVDIAPDGAMLSPTTVAPHSGVRKTRTIFLGGVPKTPLASEAYAGGENRLVTSDNVDTMYTQSPDGGQRFICSYMYVELAVPCTYA